MVEVEGKGQKTASSSVSASASPSRKANPLAGDSSDGKSVAKRTSKRLRIMEEEEAVMSIPSTITNDGHHTVSVTTTPQPPPTATATVKRPTTRLNRRAGLLSSNGPSYATTAKPVTLPVTTLAPPLHIHIQPQPDLVQNSTISTDDIKALLADLMNTEQDDDLSDILHPIYSSSEDSDSEDADENHVGAPVKHTRSAGRPLSATSSANLANKKKGASNTLANNLVNPFARKNASLLLLQDQEIKNDLEMIRKCWIPEGISTSTSVAATGEEEKETIIAPVNPPPVNAAKAILGRRTLLAPPGSPYRQQTFENNDNCSACLGIGELLCCDTCPRVFHFSCLPEGFRDGNDVAETWHCRACISQGRPNKRTVSTTHTVLPPPDDDDIWAPLMDQMDALNARVFQLPMQIRNAYQHVVTHPITGEYIDTTHTLLLKSKVEGPSIRTTRKRGLSGGVVLTEDPAPSTHTTQEGIKTCFQCVKSDRVGLSPPPLLSHTFPETRLESPQHDRTSLIMCDYCPQAWHLDCLTPPLTSIPLALRSDEWPVIDVHAHARLVDRIRGSSGHPLDQPLFEVPAVLGEVREGEGYGCADFQLLTAASSTSPIFGVERGVCVRPKWMCPLHAPYSMERVKWADGRGGWSVYADRVDELRRLRGEGERRRVERERKEGVDELRRRGLLEIDVDPVTTRLFQAPVTRVAESKILVEFREKVTWKKRQVKKIAGAMEEDEDTQTPTEGPAASCSLYDLLENAKISLRPDMARKFQEYGSEWSSHRIDELYDVTIGPDLDKFVPLVDNMLEEHISSSSTWSRSRLADRQELQESAAALLLFQLELQDRFAERHLGLDPDQA